MNFIFLLSFLTVVFSAQYATNPNVVELSADNFEEKLTKSEQIWVVGFISPWCAHCPQLISEFTKAAKALNGVVKVGVVNSIEIEAMTGWHIPTIQIFSGNKLRPDEYKGVRVAQAIVDAALQAVFIRVKAQLGNAVSNGNDVIKLSDSNFDKLVMESDDMWLVEFFAPWCRFCKKLAPHWAAAATELNGKVKLGAIDATANKIKARQFGIRSYPTIKLFPPGKKDLATVHTYGGDRTASAIVSFALEQLAPYINQNRRIHTRSLIGDLAVNPYTDYYQSMKKRCS